MCLAPSAYVLADMPSGYAPCSSSLCCYTLRHSHRLLRLTVLALICLQCCRSRLAMPVLLLPGHIHAGRLCTRLLAMPPLLSAVITRSAATISTIMKATCKPKKADVTSPQETPCNLEQALPQEKLYGSPRSSPVWWLSLQ